jgi:hypothetical protein
VTAPAPPPADLAPAVKAVLASLVADAEADRGFVKLTTLAAKVELPPPEVQRALDYLRGRGIAESKLGADPTRPVRVYRLVSKLWFPLRQASWDRLDRAGEEERRDVATFRSSGTGEELPAGVKFRSAGARRQRGQDELEREDRRGRGKPRHEPRRGGRGRGRGFEDDEELGW